MKRITAFALTLIIGVALGGWLFSRSIPRSLQAVTSCEDSCSRPSDLAGLLASAGIQRTPQLIPAAAESKECIAIRHPQPQDRVHYVLFPKRDARNILDIEAADGPYVLGCLALTRQLVQQEGVRNYRLTTNGPALQHVTYLHFHLVAR